MLVIGGLFASALTARAQTPAPSGPTLSDHIARLSIKAAQLLPYLQSEVLSHLQDWVYGIAVAVAVLVLLFSFLRLWRENAGGGNSNLIFFFLRSLYFFGLVGSSVWLIGQMAATDGWLSLQDTKDQIEHTLTDLIINAHPEQR